MDSLIGLLIFLTPAILLFAAYQFHLITEGKAFYYNKVKWKTTINRKYYLEIDTTLMKRLSFYRGLSDNGKAKFVHRLHHLLVVKKFNAKNKLVITQEMKIIACASIVQVTYGLSVFDLDNIKGFNIYPTVFYNSFMKAYLKGSSPSRWFSFG